uniref:LysR family transcriptional regulator n=1 Tax=Streptomyces sp. MK498-98F14 TaxID=1414447 RepID=X2CTS8_9ACTN|nr:LysR family transcriptional regulator [Streptomyces sp. MK498-98F14]
MDRLGREFAAPARTDGAAAAADEIDRDPAPGAVELRHERRSVHAWSDRVIPAAVRHDRARGAADRHGGRARRHPTARVR